MKRFMAIPLISLMLIVMAGYSYSASNIQIPVSQTQETLNYLDEAEKSILDELFLLTQRIDEYKEESDSLTEEINTIEKLVYELDDIIEIKQADFEGKLLVMEEFLVDYQRKGPISNLQLILNSDSIKTFIFRINSLRDISRGSTKLLEKLETERDALKREKQRLNENLELLSQKRNDLQESIVQLEINAMQLEEKLVSLEEERSQYEEWLAEVSTSLDEIKPVFSDTVEQLSDDIEYGRMSDDLLDLKFSFEGVKGLIYDKKLNPVLKDKDYPTSVLIYFFKDSMTIEMEELSLKINGNLQLKDNKTLLFTPSDGTYNGLTLEKRAIDKLFTKGSLELKFHQLLGDNSIREIKLTDGYLELSIRVSLF
ncbi:MAG: hypothetical protein RBT15_01425 [Gudongella sp.]|nr:hypothetical protein [Gudongella sp.]